MKALKPANKVHGGVSLARVTLPSRPSALSTEHSVGKGSGEECHLRGLVGRIPTTSRCTLYSSPSIPPTLTIAVTFPDDFERMMKAAWNLK